jgi:hypothetical protein
LVGVKPDRDLGRHGPEFQPDVALDGQVLQGGRDFPGKGDDVSLLGVH